MKTGEKLQQMKEMEARNLARINEHIDSAGIHRMVEIYARSTLDSLDILATYHSLKRSDLLELLVNTMWAMEQTDSQEG